MQYITPIKLLKLLFSLSVFASMFIPFYAHSKPENPITITTVSSSIRLPIPDVKPTLYSYMAKYARKWGVEPSIVYRTIYCESGWKNVQSRLYNKKYHRRELSFGLAQINLPANPHISKAQALNKKFAIRYIVSQIAQGRGRLWSCYRLLGYNK